jgi:hypothetical protein
VNDNAVMKARTTRQNMERLKLSAPVYTDTSISGLVTPHAEEVAHVAFSAHDRYYVWKVQDDEAWVLRKKYTRKQPGVLRLCRIRKVHLVRVGQESHVTCSCMTWEMKRHGCRHVTWAMGTQPTPGFFDPLWTIAHLSTYGRKGREDYTAMYDDLRRDGKMPGPCVTMWDSLKVGDVLGTKSDEAKARIRKVMALVKFAVNPCEVDDTGKILVFQPDNDSTKRLTCDDFDGEIDFGKYEAPPVDNVEDNVSSGSNTIAYNDYKDVAQRLAGRVSVVHCFHFFQYLFASIPPSLVYTVLALIPPHPLPIPRSVCRCRRTLSPLA